MVWSWGSLIWYLLCYCVLDFGDESNWFHSHSVVWLAFHCFFLCNNTTTLWSWRCVILYYVIINTHVLFHLNSLIVIKNSLKRILETITKNYKNYKNIYNPCYIVKYISSIFSATAPSFILRKTFLNTLQVALPELIQEFNIFCRRRFISPG